MSLSSPHKHRAPIAWSLLLALMIGFATVQQAFAHAYLLRSDPPANVILDSAPSTMRLWFSENISAEFSSAQLLNTSGQATAVSTQVDPNDPTLLVVTLPELTEDVYSLRWSVHSAADGHLTEGLVIFGIGSNADLGAATAVATETTIPWPELFLRWLTFTLYAGLVGAYATTYLVLNPEAQVTAVAQVQRTAQKRMLRLAWWCSLASLLAGIAWASWQVYTLTGTLSGNSSVTAVAWQWLTQTRLGLYWWARQILTLFVVALLWAVMRKQSDARLPRWQHMILTSLLLALLLVQALTSHAAALTSYTVVAVSIDALHLLAASFWVGGLLALAVGLLPLLRRRPDFAALVKTGWGPFGQWAALSVGALIITGIYSMGREVSSANALLTTLYGKALLLKIGVMLLVGMVGASNAMLLHPRVAAPLTALLRKPRGWTPLSLRHLPRLVVVEAALGLLVLLLAGVITAAPTARGAAYAATAESAPDLSQTVEDMFIKLTIDPNQSGQNLITVRAVSTRWSPPAEIGRVILRFTYLDQDFGLTSVDMAEMEPNLYLLSGNQLYLPGRWQIDAVVRRPGLEDSVARFEWVVPPSGPQQPVIVSDRPWESQLTTIAVLLLLLGVGGIVWWRTRGRPAVDDNLLGSEHGVSRL